MRSFPYPDREASREELARDLLFDKIPIDQREQIADRAWQTGVDAARALMEAHGAGSAIWDIAAASGLEVKREDKDQVAGKVRYFSEYYSGRSQIVLYNRSVALWARQNAMEPKEAEELILAHEYYHFLECTQLGLTSKQYLVPTLKLGSLVLARSGVRALSEIGAHGFARTYCQLRQPGKWRGHGGQLLQNHAVNRSEFEGRQMAAELYTGKFLTKILRRSNHGK